MSSFRTVQSIAFASTLSLQASVPDKGFSLEAENALLAGVVISTESPGFRGSGYSTGFDRNDDSLRWEFLAHPGIYRCSIRYRSPFSEKAFAGSLNQSKVSGKFPASTSFADHDAGLVELCPESNSMILGGGWHHYEIDSVTFTPEQPKPPPSPGPALPADPDAAPEARTLLTAIASTYGRKTLTGQHETGDLAHIHAVSGKHPLVLAGDLMDFSPSRAARFKPPEAYVERFITKAKEGHIVSMVWHWNAPSGLLDTADQAWWRGFYADASTFDVSAALTNPNGNDYQLILRDIDAIAVELRKFDQAGIPILWRPLHEAEGAWFWWGAKGPDAYKQLWKLLFDRLTRHHGLHRLIWVLTVEDPAWYPGNEWVDVIGVDAYPEDRTSPLLDRWQPLRDRFDGVKPIALTEFGGVPDIEKMQRLGVWWAWFCSWQGEKDGPKSASQELLRRIYHSTAAIHRDGRD